MTDVTHGFPIPLVRTQEVLSVAKSSRVHVRGILRFIRHICHVSFRSERHCLFAFGLIITGRKHVLAGLDFLRSPAHDDVSAALAVALARKAEVTEGTSQSHVAERLDGVAADNLLSHWLTIDCETFMR